jgi:hypothetical protein
MKGKIALHIVVPLVYMVAGMLAIYLIGDPEEAICVVPGPLQISPFIVGAVEASFFGVPDLAQELAMPLILADPSEAIDDYFWSVPVIEGYYETNRMLQYNPDLSSFASQVGGYIMSSSSIEVNGT